METLCSLLFGTRSTNATRYSCMIRAASRHSSYSVSPSSICGTGQIILILLQQLSDLVARMNRVTATQNELSQQMSQIVSEQNSLASQVTDLSKKLDRIEQLLLARAAFDAAPIHSFGDRNPHAMGHSRGSA